MSFFVPLKERAIFFRIRMDPTVEPLPEFPRLFLYSEEDIRLADPEKLRQMIRSITEGLKKITENLIEIRALTEKREAILLTKIDQLSRKK